MVKFLLIAIGLFQIANAVFVESNPKCAKGPSYWCTSVQTSIDCNAFKHCLQTVWTKHTGYLNDDSTMVSSQLNTLNPNKCANCLQCFKSGSAYRCPVVRNYQAEVEQLISNKLPASSICRLLTQCDGQVDTQAEEKKETLNEPTDAKVDARFECGLHPRHWCDDLETAEKCFTFEQCLMKWGQSSFKYVVKQDEKFTNSLSTVEVTEQKTCGYCIFIFTKLHDLLEQNQTEFDMETYLKGACALLPDKKQTDLCNEAVQKFTPEIYVMLRNNMDPGIICRVLKMCTDKYLTGVTIHDEIKEKEMKQQEEERNAAMEIKRILSNMKVRVINGDSAIIKTPLQEQAKKQHLLGSKDEELLAEMKSTMGVGCELCEIVLTAAKHMVNNKIDDKKVLSFINKELCSRMGNLKQTCNDYVNLEGEQILDMLKKAVDPALICEMMGFCLKIQVKAIEGETRFYDLNVRDSVNCTLCKMVFTQVKRMISNEVEQQKIVNYINANLCAKVGRSKELCRTLIDAYGPLFLEIIARDVNPGQLCEMIGMCSQADMNEEIHSLEIDQIVSAHVKSGGLQASNDSCIICEFVLKLLGEFVSQNSTEPEVEKLLEYVCQHVMPVPIRDECSAFVSQYGPVVIALLVNGIQPDKVCTFVGLCPKQVQASQIKPHPQTVYKFVDEEHLFKHRTMELAHEQQLGQAKKAQLKCTSCQFAVQYVAKQSSQQSAIDSVCQYSPRSYKEHCDSLIAAHGFQLAELIAKYADVDRVCGAIQMCTESEEQTSDKPDLEVVAIGMIELEPAKKIANVDAKNNTVECSLCIYVAELVDSLLNQNKTEDQITKELELVCNLFPTQLKDQCVAFINEYGPYIIQLVAAKLDPETTCAALKLCQKSIVNDILRNRF